MNNLTTFFRYLNISSSQLLKQSRPVAATVSSKKTSTTISKIQLKQEKETFQDVWPGILHAMVTDKRVSQVPEVADWLKKVLEYNTNGGKMLRGMITVFAYECVEKPEKITSETLDQARLLGWCVELLQGYLVMLDDIMDGSTTRRGQLCWYRRPEVGMDMALNDSVLLHMSLYGALRKYFKGHPNYIHMIELFNEMLLSTAIGQHLDLSTSKSNKNYSMFTMERLDAIAKYKTAYYTFQLPVSLGLLLANITNKEVHNQVEVTCIELGKYFQMQDDYLDCFGEESVTGKTGTDIQEGKCTWFAVQALKHSNDAQKLVFTTYYGSEKPEHVDKIRELYKDLGLRKLFYEQEKKTADVIVKQSELLQASTGVPAQLLTMLLDMLQKRRH